MKKILFLIEDLKFGGVEVSLVNLLNSIDFEKHDYEITVLMWGDRYDVLEKLETNPHLKVKIVRIDALAFAFKILNRIISAEKTELLKNKIARALVFLTVKREHADVIIRYHHAVMKNLFVRLNNNSKKILWYHTSKYGSYLDEKYISNCNKIVVVNENCKKIMLSEDPQLSEKITVIENLIPYKEIRQKANVDINLFGKDTFNIVTCARISIAKGSDIVVNACKILSEQLESFKWYIVGEPTKDTMEYAEQIKNMIKEYGLEKQLILLGGKENPFPYFKQCDLYVQPSREEAQPLAVSEAQVCGAAIVSTDTVGAKSLIENDKTGYIVDISPEALAEKVYDLYNNRDKIAQVQKNVKNIDFDDKNKRIMESFYSIIEN